MAWAPSEKSESFQVALELQLIETKQKHYNKYDMNLDDFDCRKHVHWWKDNFSLDGLCDTKWILLIVCYL